MTGQTTGPNISWLDEELRREKGIVEELRDIIDKQQITLVDQAQRILSLEDRLTRLQNQLQTIPEIRQTVQNTRDEIVAMLGDLRQDVQKRETEAVRSRQADREKDVRAVQEIRLELDRLTPLEQAVAVGQAEDRRINEGLMRLQQQIESLGRFVPQSEEARRQLADAISKNVVELQQAVDEVEELKTARSALAQRLLSLEVGASKQNQQLAELQNIRQEITAQQQEMLERQRRVDRERSQVLAEWGRRLDGFGHQIEAWADQLRFFADQHEKNRRVLRDVQTLAQDLSQQQDRLRQLQHIAEEQLRRELRDARAENDQRWAQELERREQTRRERDVRDEQRDQRLADLEEGLQDLAQILHNLEARLRETGERLDAEGAQGREMLRKMTQLASKQFDTLMNTLAETYGIQE
jgi:hypothetical protein